MSNSGKSLLNSQTGQFSPIYQRAAWVPFFENTNVIIFLCPVSCFDERLEEDPRVNRLEDSLVLWKSICSSKLLTKTQLILFMNKCDLLKRKLKRGVQVNKYLISYGDRPNEVMSVVKCQSIHLIAISSPTLLQISEKSLKMPTSYILLNRGLSTSIQQQSQ